MEDKVVLVTGSSAGIGEATAIRFASLGCKLTIHGTNKDRLEQVASKCETASPKGYKPVQVIGDMRDQSTAKELLAKTIESYGQLDVLVNNVGLFKPCSVESTEAFDVFTDTMKINLDSAVQMTLLAIPHLKKAKGNIVNVSSNLHAKHLPGGFAYCASKAAMNMFTQSIANELAPLVRANTVSPGPVATLMSTRSGVSEDTYRTNVAKACLVDRIGESDEIARLITFLASPESGFITGSDYVIDGGCTIKSEGAAYGSDQSR